MGERLIGEVGQKQTFATRLAEAIKDVVSTIQHPLALDREGDRITEQLSSINADTPPEEKEKIAQKSRDWKKKVGDFWLEGFRL